MYDIRNSGLRRFRCWLFLALAVVSLNVWASFPQPTEYMMSYKTKDSGWVSNTAACSWWLAANNVDNPPTNQAIFHSVVGASCKFYAQQNPSAINTAAMATRQAACPANSTGTSTCTCTPPSVENATHDGCKAPTCTAGPAGYYRGATSGNFNVIDVCLGGCVHSLFAEPEAGITITSSGGSYATYRVMRSATECSPDSEVGTPPFNPSTAPSTPPAKEPDCPDGQMRAYLANGTPTCQPKPVDRFCPAGYTYGTVNGKDTCISQGTSPPTSTSPTTVTKTASTESKETSTTQTNGDGSTTTTTTTSDGKGGGSTTVTTKSADGKTVESVTTKMDVPKGENDTDGKCEPGTAGCAKLGTPTDGVVSKNAVSVGVITPDNLNGFNIGNQCPADLTFEALGKTFAVPFKSVCDASLYVKPLVLLLSAFASLGIVYAALTAKA